MKKLLFIVLCFTFVMNVEAKKKSFGRNFYCEVTSGGTLIISGQGDMPSKPIRGWKVWKDLEKGKLYPWHKYLINEFIKEVMIEEGVTSIGERAFYGSFKKSQGVYTKGSIEKVTLPRSLKRINKDAFFGQEKLKTIILNDGLEYIGEAAFACTGIKSFVMPNSVKICHSIPHHVEYLVLSENLELEEISDRFSRQDFTSIVIPKKVKRIGKNAFKDCKNLQEIYFPDNLISIGDNAFEGCENLQNVHFPQKLVSIGAHSFDGCKNLQNVHFPQNLVSIGDFAFKGCDKLSLSLPEDIREIGYHAFDSDSQSPFKGTIVYLPKKLKEEKWTMYGISSEDAISYYGRVLNDNGKVILAYKKGREVTKKQDEYDNSIYYEVDDNGIKGIMEENGEWVINTNKGFKQIKEFRTNVGTKYYIVSKSRYTESYGVLDSQGRQVIPLEMNEMEYIGRDLIAFRVGVYWGVMNDKGDILVPTSRNYTSIGRYISTQNTFSFTKFGYSGECNGNGKEISLVKNNYSKSSKETTSRTVSQQQPQKPQTSSTLSSSRVSSSDNGSNNNSKSDNKSTTIVVEHHRDPVPVQEWVPCGICYGDGKCSTCFGSGSGPGSGGRCISCGYSGKCRFCNGQGGRYQTVYR